MTDLLKDVDVILKEGGALSWLMTIALAMFLTATIKVSIKIIHSRLLIWSQKTAGIWDDTLVCCLERSKSLVIFTWIFYHLLKTVRPEHGLLAPVHLSVVVLTVVQIAIWTFTALKMYRDALMKKSLSGDASSAAAISLLFNASQFVLLSVFVLIGLSHLGVNIGALLAGLGVGGIAVALAAQNVLGDLLASLSIVLDKPFVVGDFVTVGSDVGTVEYVGLKSTRVRSLSGEEIVFSNKDLLESRVRNFKRMWKRRVLLKIGVVYATEREKLMQIPVWLEAITKECTVAEFDRAHFVNFGAYSLDFELVFFVNDPDFNKHMDVQQDILLRIHEKFVEQKVEFAFPTQLLYTQSLNQPAHEPNQTPGTGN